MTLHLDTNIEEPRISGRQYIGFWALLILIMLALAGTGCASTGILNSPVSIRPTPDGITVAPDVTHVLDLSLPWMRNILALEGTCAVVASGRPATPDVHRLCLPGVKPQEPSQPLPTKPLIPPFPGRK